MKKATLEKAALGFVIGMADIVTRHRAFSCKLATTCHFSILLLLLNAHFAPIPPLKGSMPQAGPKLKKGY